MSKPAAPARRTVSFVVPLLLGDDGKPVRWLAEDGSATADQKLAVEFTFNASPNVVERSRIRMAMHEIMGGVNAYVDLQQGIDEVRNRMMTGLVAEIWPDGRPKAINDQQIREQDERIGKAWVETTDPALVRYREALAEMVNTWSHIEFLASWQSLIVNPPEGWRVIADRELRTSVVAAIAEAFQRELFEDIRGKTRPSSS